MKLGYPCINWSIGCKGDRTFRLKSYSEDRLIHTVSNNLDCLQQMLTYNAAHDLLFFRITSDLIPFASHPICTFDWQDYFKKQFQTIGSYIAKHKIRISMHPDQFIVLNSPRKEVVQRSIAELNYHAEVLDLLGLDSTAKIQLHIGGVYNDKNKSIQRFQQTYQKLPDSIKKRLVIENDDTLYTVQDCLDLHTISDIPLLFDAFHHSCHNHDESISEAMNLTKDTWAQHDGIPLVDYSSQEPGKKKGKHAETIDLKHFQTFLQQTQPYDFDVMLEIKDKEKSALQVQEILRNDPRFKKHTKKKGVSL